MKNKWVTIYRGWIRGYILCRIGLHKWKYSTFRFGRTCEKCGRRQEMVK